MEITVDDKAVRSMLNRVEGSVGESIHSRFGVLGRMLRDELRPTIPKRTGRARAAIFFRQGSAPGSKEIDLLVGGDLAQAPHLIYIELGTRFQPHHGPGPIQAFRDKNEERIQREIEEAVGAGVRAAGGNG